MTNNHATKFRSKIILLIIGLICMGFVSCASTRQAPEQLKFPSDYPQPYLTLEQVIDGTEEAPNRSLRHLLRVILGPEYKSGLNQPTDMVMDAQGRLLIADSEAGAIVVLNRETGGSWFVSERVVIPQIKLPLAIAASPDLLFISDLSSDKVFTLSYTFEVVNTIHAEEMQRPGDLCYDSFAKRLLIADPPANRIFIHDPSGTQLAQIGPEGSTQSRLQNPISMTVNPVNGDLFVVDAIARKVKHYDTDLNFISSFGEYDQVPGSFAFPKGIAHAGDGTLFIADAAFGNIQMFDPSGALLFFFGETGTEQGQFLMPRNLFIDVDQRLYVADPYNNRVQVFQYFAQQ